MNKKTKAARTRKQPRAKDLSAKNARTVKGGTTTLKRGVDVDKTLWHWR
jgi:hypothetical protein